MSNPSNPAGSSASPLRAVFAVLAVFDALLLAYLVLTHDWANFAFRTNYETPAAFIVIGITGFLLIAEKLFFLAFFGAIGFGIYRQIRPPADQRRGGRAILASIVLLLGLAAIGWLFYAVIRHATDGPPGFFLNRITLFDSLSERATPFGGLLGMTQYVAGSIGAFFVLLVIAAYLAEKYFFAWLGVRWPVAIVPVVAIGYLAWAVVDGERHQRAWPQAQEWAPLEASLPWVDAVAACEARGESWRLARRQELGLYFASQPAAIASWKDVVWTSAMAEDADYAVAIDVAQRRSGFFDRRSQLARDESPCERHDPQRHGHATDWFTALRPQVCAHTLDAPNLYTPGLKPAVLQTGNVQVTQPPAHAICIRSHGVTPIVRGWRRYQQEQEFTRVSDFAAAVAQRCAKNPGRARAACFAFVPPGIDETGDERFMRAFCELDGRQPEGCYRYALLMEKRGDQPERVARYRGLACTGGYRPACSGEVTIAPAAPGAAAVPSARKR